MTEAEYASRFIESVSPDWEIFQEVVTGVGITDIVLRSGQILWAIEVKKSMSLTLIDQAIENTRYYHYSSVVVPKPKKTDARGFLRAQKILQQHGLGMFTIEEYPYSTHVTISEMIRPKLYRSALAKKVTLVDQQKTGIGAGSKGGGYWTVFANTKELFIEYVRKHPGCSYKTAVENIQHHYSSASTARSCLGQYVRNGVISEVELTNNGLFLVGNRSE